MIQVGEYVRTTQGYIAKAEDVSEDIILFDSAIRFYYEEDWGLTKNHFNEIVKHSFNIIDLIEEGDVIHFRVNNVTLETKNYIEGITEVNKELLENIKDDKDYHILGIVTKRKFEQEEYKI